MDFIPTDKEVDMETNLTITKNDDLKVKSVINPYMSTTDDENEDYDEDYMFRNTGNKLANEGGMLMEDDQPTVMKPVWNVSEELQRRITEFKSSDQRITEIFKKSVKDSEFKKVHGWKKKDVDKYMIQWTNFMKIYLNSSITDEELEDKYDLYNTTLPKNYSPVSLFPVHYMATVGAAGTGKSESVKSYQSQEMNMFTTSYTNSASEEYTKGLVSMNHPQCRDYEQHCKTLIKTLGIPFTFQDVQDIIAKVGQNESEVGKRLFAMEERYVNECRNWTEEELSKETRKLAVENLKGFRELIIICYDNMKYNMTHRSHYKFRLGGLPENHPFYQPREATFDWIADIDDLEERASCLPHDKKLTNVDRKICQSMVDEEHLRSECGLRIICKRHVTTQDAYKRYCLSNSNMKTKPYIMTQQPIAMIEEDGKTPVFLLYLHGTISVITDIMYNTPHHHIGPRTWFSNGSDAQIGAVNSCSALSHVIASSYNTVARGEFYRRNKTETTSAISELSRILPNVLENNLEITTETMETLAFNEKSSAHVKDPAHFSSGKRVHFIHKDNNEFIKSMEAAKKATIPVNDLLLVSNNVIEVTGVTPKQYTTPTSGNPYGVNTKNLSRLKEEEALRNRSRAWRDKLIVEYSQAIHTTKPMRSLLEVATEDIFKVSKERPDYPESNFTSTKYNPQYDVKMNDAAQLMSDFRRIYKKKMRSEDKTDTDKSDPCYADDESLNREEEEKNKAMTLEIMSEMDCGEMNEEEKCNLQDQELKEAETKEIYVELELQNKENEEKWVKGDEQEAKRRKIYKRTKVFITMKASEALSMKEHLLYRTHAESIVDYIGDGLNYANNCHTNSRKTDQLGKFVYDPASDTVVIYSGIDFLACVDEKVDDESKSLFNINKLVESAMNNEQSVQMYLTFKRKRMFAVGKELCHLGNKTTVTPRGVNGTISDIMKDQSFNKSGTSAGFKLMVYVGAVHNTLLQRAMVKLREEGNTVQEEVNMIKRYGEISVEDGIDKSHAEIVFREVAREYAQVVESMNSLFERETGMKTNFKSKDDESETNTPEVESDNVGAKLTKAKRGKKRKLPNKNASLQLKICNYMDLMRVLITKIIRVDPDGCNENVLSFYLNESPIYKFRHRIKAETSVKLMEMFGDVPLQFLGNSDHPALTHVIEEAKSKTLELYGQKNYAGYMEESSMNMFGRYKSYTKIAGWALQQHYPSTLYSSSLVMKIGSVLVATSDPNPPSNKITWHEMFGDKQNSDTCGDSCSVIKYRKQALSAYRFGLMSKRLLSTIHDGDKLNINQSFPTHRGAFLGFPNKWRCGGGPEGSGVIVKLSNGRKTVEVMYFDKTKLNLPEKERYVDARDAVFDSSHVHAYPVPFIMDLAMTSHAIQGRTSKGKLFIDFDSMVSKHTDKLIFDDQTTKAAMLVCATRPDNPKNLHFANTTKLHHLFIKPVSAESERKRKKMKTMFKTEHVR